MSLGQCSSSLHLNMNVPADLKNSVPITDTVTSPDYFLSPNIYLV